MDIAGAFVFQQAIPINIQKKIKVPQLHERKREGEVDDGIDKCDGHYPAKSSQSNLRLIDPLVLTKVQPLLNQVRLSNYAVASFSI